MLRYSRPQVVDATAAAPTTIRPIAAIRVSARRWARLDDRVRLVVHAACLLGLNLAVFSGVYFSADSFPDDFPVIFYTLPAYWIASLSAGEWPSWIPYIAMGLPLGAVGQSGILYPPFWIFVVLHVPFTLHAASVLHALHIFAGGLGSYLLVRRLFASPSVALVGGAAYLLYGGFFVNAQHPDIVRAFALLPWLFWTLLLPEQQQVLRIGRFAWSSALSLVNLALPAFMFLFVTGGYPGDILAFACLLPVFAGLQLVRNIRSGQRAGSAVLDAAILSGLTVLGGLMASAFLLPVLSASDELTRTASGPLPTSSRIYLRLSDLYGLVLSSTLVRPELHRDIGMQLPLVLFPFAIFLRRRAAWLLLPFFGVGVVALVMALDITSGLSQALASQVTFLGYSRFPAGDYRTFVALAVLLVLLAGLREALQRWHEGPRPGPLYTLGLGLVGIVVGSALVAAGGGAGPALEVVARQSVPALILALVLMLGTHTVRLPWIAGLIAAASVISVWPVLDDMRVDWQVHDAERWLLNDANMNVWRDGNWRADQVFREQLVSRPPRNPMQRQYANHVLWNAYLNGQFFTTDDNGTILQARRTVERQPRLLAYMVEGSRLVALPCGSGLCDRGASDVQVPVEVFTAPPPAEFSWQPVTYGRSSVQYYVELTEPALVVENELYARGWQATIDEEREARAPVRVNKAIRGWVLPAGEHALNLSFHAPGLEAGFAVSSAALAAYALVLALVLVLRPRPSVSWSSPEVAARTLRRSRRLVDWSH